MKDSMGTHFEIINDTTAFLALREEWNTLLTQSGIPSPFLTWEWMYSWWEAYADQNKRNTLAIVTCREDDRLAGILPGYRTEHYVGLRKVKKFALLGAEFESSDYLEVISRNPEDPTITQALFSHLLKSGQQVDILTLDNILTERAFLQIFLDFSRKNNFHATVRHHRNCPYIPVTGSYEDLMHNLSKNFRYNLRRGKKKLFDEFGVAFTLVTEKNTVHTAIDDLFALHEKRFSDKDEDSIFRADLRKNFHQIVSQRFFAKNILRIFQLKRQGTPIAILYCFEFADEMFFVQTGMDPEWGKWSVGQVLIGQVIEYTHQNHLKRFDFMRGEDDYKFKWTQHIREMVVVNAGVTPKGRSALHCHEKIRALKERLKQIISEKHWNAIKQLMKSGFTGYTKPTPQRETPPRRH